MFESSSKCRIWIFSLLAFAINFCLIKVICLVTLFDHKIQVFKNSPKSTIFGILKLTFVYSKCKRTSLRSQSWMRLFLWFSNTMVFEKYCKTTSSVIGPSFYCFCSRRLRRLSNLYWRCRQKQLTTTSQTLHL